MFKILEHDVGDVEEMCAIGKALSSPVRVEMFKLLSEESLIIGEIAKKLNIPGSSAAFHLKILEEAGLIRMEEQPGTRGNMKLCKRKVDRIFLNLFLKPTDIADVFTSEMPVGAYTECQVKPTCGIGTTDGMVINEDIVGDMFLPDRLNAGIIWGSAGYVEYRFPNGVPSTGKPRKIGISMEVCSEAPGFRQNWKSDITVWINGKECGTWTSPGDFGDRRGRLNPSVWPNGSTQYGKQVIWEIDEESCRVNGLPAEGTETVLSDLLILEKPYITLRVGNKPDAEYVGGFNLFGRGFGDYDQGIILSVEYM